MTKAIIASVIMTSELMASVTYNGKDIMASVIIAKLLWQMNRAL